VAVAEPVPVPVPVGVLRGAVVGDVTNAVAAYKAVEEYVWHADGVGAGWASGVAPSPCWKVLVVPSGCG